MEPNEIVAALVRLKDVVVVHYQRSGRAVELMVEQTPGTVSGASCGARALVHERPVVHCVDLPVYGTPMSLAWRKHRMRCPDEACPRRSWTLEDHRIAAKNCLLTTRAAKWATVQVGGGRTVSEVAAELACDWHTVNDEVTTYGEALLAADRNRLTRTTAVGLDETAFVRRAGHQVPAYATTIADVANRQIRYGALDMSTAYAAVYTVMLPKAKQVLDPFHVIALASRSLGTIRRRVQVQQLGHRGRRDDPLYRVRRALLVGEEKLDQAASQRLWSLLALGDPHAEVAIAYRALP